MNTPTIANTVPVEDRRAHRRQRMFKSGAVSPDGHFCAIGCTVRNLSETGVRIQVGVQSAIPSNFVFQMKDGSIRTKARIVWRHEKEIGVNFCPS